MLDYREATFWLNSPVSAPERPLARNLQLFVRSGREADERLRLNIGLLFVRAKTVVRFWKKKREREREEIIVLPGIGCVTRSRPLLRASRLPHTCEGIYRGGLALPSGGDRRDGSRVKRDIETCIKSRKNRSGTRPLVRCRRRPAANYGATDRRSWLMSRFIYPE